MVRPGSRVSYLPSAALVLRTSALRELGGFDERMRFGEDVDLIWRLAAGTGLVRYEPAAVVRHEPRPDWRAWAKQRFGYGTSAAPLALRHGRAVAPVKVSFWSAAAWAALALGRPATGVAIAAGTAALLPRKLAPFGVPARESLQLAARGHLGAGRLLGDAVTRSWWPVAVPLLAATRAGRPLLAAAFARHAVDWYRDRPLVDLPAGRRLGSPTTSPTGPGSGGAHCATARSPRCCPTCPTGRAGTGFSGPPTDVPSPDGASRTHP
ncbi:glycosyltransferase family 2 protein [Kitasatospora gansuensis]